MRALGIILVVLGIFMLVTPGISFTKKEKLVDVGPVEINKNEKKRLDWPVWAGGIALAAGVVILVSSGTRRK